MSERDPMNQELDDLREENARLKEELERCKAWMAKAVEYIEIVHDKSDCHPKETCGHCELLSGKAAEQAHEEWCYLKVWAGRFDEATDVVGKLEA